LLHEVADAARVDLHARAHRRRDRDRAQIAALRSRRLRSQDLVEHRAVVLDQRALVERLLADRNVDDPRAIGAVLDLAGLDVGHRLRDVEGDRPGLRARHLALRAEDPAEAADGAHHVGRGDRDVEVGEALLHLGGQVVAADEVRAGVLGLLGLLTLREHRHRDGAAGAVRQEERAAQLLVGMADVHAETQVHLDGLVELGRLERLQRSHGVERRIGALAVDRGAGGRVLLARHQAPTSTPIERALPAMMCIAASTSFAFRSGSLVSAISRSWARLIVPTLVRFGSPEPFWMLSASRINTAAGGVFVMNVNERSSNTLISTGVIRPAFGPCVAALNALQNSMMLTPCWPSAGPTGGAGLAWPAGICSLMTLMTFFAIPHLPCGASAPA